MKQLNNLRVLVDSLVNSAKTLEPSREVSLCITNLQRSFMWMGMMLKTLGEETPYKESMNPDSKVIEPMADHTDNDLSADWKRLEYDQTAKVKSLRGEIDKVFHVMKPFFKTLTIIGESEDGERHHWKNLYAIQSHLALDEGKLWLGMELRRISDAADKK